MFKENVIEEVLLELMPEVQELTTWRSGEQEVRQRKWPEQKSPNEEKIRVFKEEK